jgi:hypothetical protein
MADETEFRDLTELGELCGCTDLQRKFSEGLLAGLSQTEAAFRAGYSGARDSAQLRSAASQAAQTKPVQALLALAESRGLGTPNAPGDREELLRILWSHARSKDKQSSIRATVELDRIGAEERAAQEPQSQLELVREMLAGWRGLGHVGLSFLGSIEWYGPRFNLDALPLFPELAPQIKADYPEIWERLLEALDPDCRAKAETAAAGPGVPVAQLAAKPKLDEELNGAG